MPTPGWRRKRPPAPAKTCYGNVVWTIPSLPAGQTVELRIKYRCLSAGGTAEQPCHRHLPGRRAGEAESSIEVRPETATPPATTPSGLSVAVTGLHNAVTAGQYLTYFVRVKNSGLTPERQVVLTATVPVAMAIDRLGTTGPPPTKPTYPDHTVTFTPLETLGPGETLTYLIHVQATRPGVFRFGVDVTSRGLGQPIHGDEVTEVLQPPRTRERGRAEGGRI